MAHDRSATSPTVQHHALPGWFITFQDTAGLSLLVLALMGINGIVYASGVVKNVEDPASWGVFGTVLFVLFFLAGTAMPGVALRAGAGIFVGEWYRRLACLLVSVLFFVLEVWCSVTERSLTTITTPADRWLLSLVGLPNMPFSPTVLAIAFAISAIVVVWGLVTGVTQAESAEDVAHREELKTIKAKAKAERRVVFAGSVGQAGRAAFDGAKAVASAGESGQDTPDDTPGMMEPQGTDDDEPKAPTMRSRAAGRQAVPSDRMSAPQFRAYLRENGVAISDEKARAIVQATAGFEKIGTTYCASKGALMRTANRMLEQARRGDTAEAEAPTMAG